MMCSEEIWWLVRLQANVELKLRSSASFDYIILDSAQKLFSVANEIRKLRVHSLRLSLVTFRRN